MYGILDLTWKPSSQSTSPPVGRAPAIVRNDPYTHLVVVERGWADLGSEEFVAQLRLERLTGSTAGDATADFTVNNLRGTVDVDGIFAEAPAGADLAIEIALLASETTALPAAFSGFWDLQQVDAETLLAGKAKVLDDVTRAA